MFLVCFIIFSNSLILSFSTAFSLSKSATPGAAFATAVPVATLTTGVVAVGGAATELVVAVVVSPGRSGRING